MVCGFCALAQNEVAPRSYVLVKVGELYAGADGSRTKVDLLIENGRVVRIVPSGTESEVPGTHEYDFSCCTVIPSGIGLFSLPEVSGDSHGIAPSTILADSLDSQAPDFEIAARMGATAFVLEAGVQTVIGGVSAVVRPLDHWTNRRIIVAALGLDLRAEDRSSPPKLTAMEAIWEIRRRLLLARADIVRHPIPSGPKSDLVPFRKLLKGEIRAQFEAAKLDEVARAVNIATEFQVPLLLTGVLDTPKAGIPYRDVDVLLGPVRLDEMETIWHSYRTLRDEGIRVGMLTGNSIPLTAALVASRPYTQKMGISDEELLQAFTGSPAEVVGAGGQIGKLAIGQSADFLVIQGKLFESASQIENVFIEGQEVYARQAKQ